MTVSENGAKPTALADVSNDAEPQIALTQPYVISVTIEGTAAILFHRWSVEAVAEKAAAAKGSAAKKSDDIDSYVWRDEAGLLCLPGEYLRMSAVNAGRYRQDPRSPRKSAMDLCKAGLVVLTELAPITAAGAKKPTKDWDYLDQRRVTVQRNGITRMRPAMLTGWRAKIDLMVNLPEYMAPMFIHSLLSDAGRLVGVGDFRPTYGRFAITGFDIGT
jgi:hypothetical protein